MFRFAATRSLGKIIIKKALHTKSNGIYKKKYLNIYAKPGICTNGPWHVGAMAVAVGQNQPAKDYFIEWFAPQRDTSLIESQFKPPIKTTKKHYKHLQTIKPYVSKPLKPRLTNPSLQNTPLATLSNRLPSSKALGLFVGGGLNPTCTLDLHGIGAFCSRQLLNRSYKYHGVCFIIVHYDD